MTHKLMALKRIRLPIDVEFLWKILQERVKHPNQNISHKTMPKWGDHVRFCRSNPYRLWYTIWDRRYKLGTCYLTRNSEIGVTILEEYQGKGYGKQAVLCLMYSFPINYWLANINPANTRSVELFKSLGFHLYESDPGVQDTYILQRSEWIDSGLYEYSRRELDGIRIE